MFLNQYRCRARKPFINESITENYLDVTERGLLEVRAQRSVCFILVIKGHSQKVHAHFLYLISPVPHKYQYNRREFGDKQELHDK